MSVQRGRKSADERSILATLGNLEAMARPEPPANLEPEEAAIWREIVESRTPDWFPTETHILLEQYCKHKAGLPYIDKMINELKRKAFGQDYKDLVKIRAEETKIIGMLATKMRLTQQSSYDKTKVRIAQRVQKNKSPWQR